MKASNQTGGQGSVEAETSAVGIFVKSRVAAGVDSSVIGLGLLIYGASIYVELMGAPETLAATDRIVDWLIED